MRPQAHVRILIVAVLAIVATIGMLATPRPAGAVDYTACSSVSGLNLSGQQDSMSGCTGPTGGSGVFAGPVSSPMTVSWAGGGTTTISFTTKVHKKTKCSGGATEMALSGHATMSTGPAQTDQRDVLRNDLRRSKREPEPAAREGREATNLQLGAWSTGPAR